MKNKSTTISGIHASRLSTEAVLASIGAFVIFCLVASAIFAPWVAPYGETASIGGAYEPWSTAHPFGTDSIGRDILSRLIYGARNTIGLAFVTTCLAFFLGSAMGTAAAALGGWVDLALGRLIDLLMAIPQLIFALLILTVVGSSAYSLILVIGVLESTRVFRLSRSLSVSIVRQDFVDVAKLRGESLFWIIFREVIPVAFPNLLAEFGLRFSFVILFVSALSFLGLGLQPPTADWGALVRENAALIAFGDVTPLLPAGAIALMTIAVNLVVDWYLGKIRRGSTL